MSFRRYLMVGLFCLGAVLEGLAQQPAQTSASTQQEVATPAAPAASPAASAVAAPSAAEATETVRQRAKQFYALLLKGDRTGAGKMVAPESMAVYDQTDLRSMQAAVVENVIVSGETAKVEVTRTFAAPIAMSIPWTDNWTLMNGEWYFTLPKATGDTPFGMVKPSTGPVDEKAIQERIARENRVVDPDQAIKALEKYAREHPGTLKNEPQTVSIPVPQQPANNAKPAKKKKSDKKSGADSSTVKQNTLTSPPTAPKQQ